MTPFPTFITDTVSAIADNFRKYTLLVLHPHNYQHTHLLAALMENPPGPLYYYKLDIEDTRQLHFINNLVHTLNDQTPLFGYNVKRVLDKTDNVRQLAENLAQDLSLLDQEDYLLILDDYDQIDPHADVQSLIEQLLFLLPSHCHLLIHSRTMPSFPWTRLVARNKAMVIDGGALMAGTL